MAALEAASPLKSAAAAAQGTTTPTTPTTPTSSSSFFQVPSLKPTGPALLNQLLDASAVVDSTDKKSEVAASCPPVVLATTKTGTPPNASASGGGSSRSKRGYKYKTYSPSDMQRAYTIFLESKSLGNKISIRRLAKVSGLPYATLRDHINGRRGSVASRNRDLMQERAALAAARANSSALTDALQASAPGLEAMPAQPKLSQQQIVEALQTLVRAASQPAAMAVPAADPPQPSPSAPFLLASIQSAIRVQDTTAAAAQILQGVLQEDLCKNVKQENWQQPRA